MSSKKQESRLRRRQKITKKIQGTSERPRLSIFRSNNNMYAQLIDDDSGVTLAAASDVKEKKSTGIKSATKVGQEIAKAAAGKKITTCVFDRSGFKYHGRVKALADGAREGGLKF